MKPGRVSDRPLGRGKPLRSSSPLKTLATLRRSQPKHAAPRDTGFSPAVRALVMARSAGRCEGCGIWLGRNGGQVQRRRAASSRVRNTIQNAARLCDSCHAAADQRDPLMNASGFWLASTQNPREVPVRLHGADGPTLWLTGSGTYSVTPPGHEMP